MRLGAMYVEVRKAHSLVFSWRFSVGRTDHGLLYTSSYYTVLHGTDPKHLKTRLFPRVLLRVVYTERCGNGVDARVRRVV